LQVPHRGVRITTLSRECGKVPRHQLQSFQIATVTECVQSSVSETDVGAVKAEVRQVRVAVRVAWCDRSIGQSRQAEVVRVVASLSTVDVVEVGGLESVRGSAGVDGGLVDAAESLVCGDALAHVEGVERQVAAVVVWEETTVDGELSVFSGDAETGLNSFGET
jgi:hypothetical protein